jgi:hypothetical protein
MQRVQQYDPYQTEEEANYRQFLLEKLELLSDLSVSLRKSFTENKANREDQYSLISLSVELWGQLYPKIQGTDMEASFKRFLPFYINPRLFLSSKCENLIWLLTFEIRVAYEELGLTNIK